MKTYKIGKKSFVKNVINKDNPIFGKKIFVLECNYIFF